MTAGVLGGLWALRAGGLDFDDEAALNDAPYHQVKAVTVVELPASDLAKRALRRAAGRRRRPARLRTSPRSAWKKRPPSQAAARRWSKKSAFEYQVPAADPFGRAHVDRPGMEARRRFAGVAGVRIRRARRRGCPPGPALPADVQRVHREGRVHGPLEGRNQGTREERQAARASGKAGQAAQREVVDEAKRRQQREEEEREAKAWQELEPHVLTEAVAQVKKVKTLTSARAKALADLRSPGNAGRDLVEQLGATWFKTPVAAWLVLLVTGTGVRNVR